jgi:hypothetical protein
MSMDAQHPMPAIGKIALFSPHQVFVASFLAGPLVGIYLLKKNFDAMQNRAGSRNVLIYGTIFIVIFILTIPFSPEHLPNILIPLAYAVAARLLADRYQMKKEAIAASDSYRFQSNWIVFAASVACFFIVIVPAVIWTAFVFQMEDKIDLKDMWEQIVGY